MTSTQKCKRISKELLLLVFWPASMKPLRKASCCNFPIREEYLWISHGCTAQTPRLETLMLITFCMDPGPSTDSLVSLLKVTHSLGGLNLALDFGNVRDENTWNLTTRYAQPKSLQTCIPHHSSYECLPSENVLNMKNV